MSDPTKPSVWASKTLRGLQCSHVGSRACDWCVALALDAIAAERDAAREAVCANWAGKASCVSDTWNAGFAEAKSRYTALLTAERDALADSRAMGARWRKRVEELEAAVLAARGEDLRDTVGAKDDALRALRDLISGDFLLRRDETMRVLDEILALTPNSVRAQREAEARVVRAAVEWARHVRMGAVTLIVATELRARVDELLALRVEPT